MMNYTESQVSEYVENVKDGSCIKLFKSVLSFLDTIIAAIVDKQGLSNFFQLREMRSFKRLFIHGSNIIQHSYDIGIYPNPIQSGVSPYSHLEREKSIHENMRKFSKLFTTMNPLQFRDLISSVENKFFTKVIEVKATKGDSGIFLLADLMMSFQQQ